MNLLIGSRTPCGTDGEVKLHCTACFAETFISFEGLPAAAYVVICLECGCRMGNPTALSARALVQCPHDQPQTIGLLILITSDQAYETGLAKMADPCREPVSPYGMKFCPRLPPPTGGRFRFGIKDKYFCSQCIVEIRPDLLHRWIRTIAGPMLDGKEFVFAFAPRREIERMYSPEYERASLSFQQEVWALLPIILQRRRAIG